MPTTPAAARTSSIGIAPNRYRTLPTNNMCRKLRNTAGNSNPEINVIL